MFENFDESKKEPLLINKGVQTDEIMQDLIENGQNKYYLRKRSNEYKRMISSNEDISFNLFFRPIKHGSLRSSIFCMICVTLGTGMLPLPYFFRTNGIILTLIMYFFCSIPTYFTLQLLIKMGYEFKTYDFIGLVNKVYNNNKYMEIYATIVLLINSFGSIIMWDVFITQFVRDILEYINPNYSKDINVVYVSIIILILIQIPLAVYQNKGKIEFDILASIGILQIIYVIIILLIEFPYYASVNFNLAYMGKKTTYFNFNMKIVEMPFVFFIAFGNHSTILSSINEVKNKNNKNVLLIGKRTFFSQFFIYIIILFLNFFSTYNKTSQIFLMRPNLSFLMFIGEFFMIILMICNINLYYFTTMPTLEYLLNDSYEFTEKQNYLASFTVLTCLMFCSFYIVEVDSILTFLGVTAQVSLIFIIPISIYIKWKQNEMNFIKKVILYTLIFFFSILGIGGFIIMFINQFTEVIESP